MCIDTIMISPELLHSLRFARKRASRLSCNGQASWLVRLSPLKLSHLRSVQPIGRQGTLSLMTIIAVI